MGGRLAGVTVSVAAAAACALAWRWLAPAPPAVGMAAGEPGGPPAAADAAPAGEPLLDEIHQAISQLSRPQLFAMAHSQGLRAEALFDLTAEQLAGELRRLARSRSDPPG